MKFKIARIAKHMWEEPVISGEKGSGTVFFSGCNMKCVYCQNFKISHQRDAGVYLSQEEFIDQIVELSKTVHNINFVTPSHYIKVLPKFLRELKNRINVPIVYNTSSYESVNDLKQLEGLVDIYLPDFKYADNEIAKKYSGVNDYVETARLAITEMRRQQPKDIFTQDPTPIMVRGVIVRHLILPNNIRDSLNVIDEIANIDKTLYVSLMSQYFPTPNVPNELNRRITRREYNIVKKHFFKQGLYNGFQQDPASAIKDYTPDF